MNFTFKEKGDEDMLDLNTTHNIYDTCFLKVLNILENYKYAQIKYGEIDEYDDDDLDIIQKKYTDVKINQSVYDYKTLKETLADVLSYFNTSTSFLYGRLLDFEIVQAESLEDFKWKSVKEYITLGVRGIDPSDKYGTDLNIEHPSGSLQDFGEPGTESLQTSIYVLDSLYPSPELYHKDDVSQQLIDSIYQIVFEKERTGIYTITEQDGDKYIGVLLSVDF